MEKILTQISLDSKDSFLPTRNFLFTNLKRVELESALKTTGFITANSRNVMSFSTIYTSYMIICELIFQKNHLNANMGVAKVLAKLEIEISITRFTIRAKPVKHRQRKMTER
jgi:hypothetical protein